MALSILLLLGFALQQPLPPHPATNTGGPALAATALDIAIWLLLLLVGTALGQRALRVLKLPDQTPAEAVLWALPTGVILLGYPVYFLGLLGHFRREWLAALLAGLVLVLRHDLVALARQSSLAWRAAWSQWRAASLGQRLLWGGLALWMGGTWLTALTPPWLYDALWYHLQGPRLFLEAGRLYPEWNNWPANYAFALNMVYALAMALGSDVAPRLLHWTFAVIFLLLLYRTAHRWIGSGAWLALAFILTMPHFPTQLAPSALLDVATATLEFMAYLGLWRSLERKSLRWFWASALWGGLAASIKMAALPALAVIGVVWLWRGFPSSWRARVRFLLLYGAVALFLLAPWYGKNLIWFGTPFFPGGLSSARPDLLLRAQWVNEYVRGVESGWNRLLFWLWLVIHPQRLDYMSPPLALPLFLLLLPWAGWRIHSRKPAPLPLVLALLRGMLWIVGPPGIRYLLAAFGLFGLAIAYGLTQPALPPPRIHRILRQVVAGATGILVLWNGLIWLFFFAELQPWNTALGLESREAFLLRYVEGYRGWTYIREHVPNDARVLLVGDARHYYCPPQCYPEADHFTWTRWVFTARFDPQQVLTHLEQTRIRYLWLHHSSLQWLLDHDPKARFARSYAFLREQIWPLCGQVVYQDQDVTLIHLSCLDASSP